MTVGSACELPQGSCDKFHGKFDSFRPEARTKQIQYVTDHSPRVWFNERSVSSLEGDDTRFLGSLNGLTLGQ